MTQEETVDIWEHQQTDTSTSAEKTEPSRFEPLQMGHSSPTGEDSANRREAIAIDRDKL